MLNTGRTKPKEVHSLNETFLTGLQIGGRVGEKGGIPTFLLLDVIAKLWTQKEIQTYPCA